MMDPTGLYRPSLQRSNASTGSLPLLDSTNAPLNNGKRKPSISTAKIAALNATAASVQSSPMASPAMPRGNGALLSPQRSYFDLSSRPSIDMIRTESTESTKSLKSKSSKKDLKELGRSTTPLSSFGKSSSSRKASLADLKAQQQDDNGNDDSGMDESFTCCYGNEFDRQHRAALAKVSKMPTTEESEIAHQRWLDATFRKLSQKSIARYSQQFHPHNKGGRAPSFSASNMQRVSSIDEGCESEPASPNAAKRHFLDFTSIISPIPSMGKQQQQQSLSPPNNSLQVPSLGTTGSQSANVTPRPSDFQRFPLPLTPSPVFHDALELQPASPRHAIMPPPTQPLLRSRRSEDSLTMRRRMQRQPSLPSGGAGGPISPLFGEMTLDGHPVPRLPDWAKSENRMNSSTNVRSHNGQQSMEMARTVSHNVTSNQQSLQRPIDMNRATSHDTGSLQLSLGAPLMSHFDQWDETENRSLPMDQRPSIRPTVRPLNLNNETSSHRRNMINNSSNSSATSISTNGSNSFHINRESISSAASDSDISSSISSVPQTPVSKFNNLPNGGPIIMHRDSHVNSVYYDADPISEQNNFNNAAGTEDQLATIRAVVGGWAEEKSKSAPPTAQFMTPRAQDGRRYGSVPHVANIFTASEALSNISETQTNKQRSPDSKAILHGKAIHGGRPRANTTSSMNASSSSDSVTPTSQIHMRNGSESLPSKEKHVSGTASPVSPERVSSLSHARKHSDTSKRASIASNISNSTSHSVISATSSSGRSSGSSGSGTSALLSYMRNHSQSNLHGTKVLEAEVAAKTPSSSSGNTLHAAASPTSSSDTATSSPIKRGGTTAEELAHSIGRRFGRGIASASAVANRS